MNDFLDEPYFLPAPSPQDPNRAENAASSGVASTSPHLEEMRPDSSGVFVSVGTIQEQNEQDLRRTYLKAEKDPIRQAGAKALLAYLKNQTKSLAEVTPHDLQQWALTPRPKGRGTGKLPKARAFEGAKAVCALAADFGHIDAQRARELASCNRPHYDMESLPLELQNQNLTLKERENKIRLTYHIVEKNPNRQAGANGFLAYLAAQEKSLAIATASDLAQWGRTALTIGPGKGNLPSALAFEGAKGLCTLATEFGLLHGQRAKELAECPRPHGDLDELRIALQNPALTPQERESLIRLSYQSAEPDPTLQMGANGIQAYLESQSKSLSEVTPRDLEEWALTPLAKGKALLPSAQSFEGAKALCALAVKVGYIDAQQAEMLAECTRPHGNVDALRILLQNPALTPKQRDYHIHLNFQSTVKDGYKQAGASALLTYLENHAKSLAEVTTADLEQWALTQTATGKVNMPNERNFAGAKALCAIAAEVGLIDAQRAKELAECIRPHAELNTLRRVLQNPALTPQEREYHIHFNYKSREHNIHRQVGARGLLTHLEHQQKSLAEVTTSDLKEWALTPMATDPGYLPNAQAFDGAKALCALAARVGYIDAQRAAPLADYPRPQFDMGLLQSMLQNPTFTPKEREYHIRLAYQSVEQNPNRIGGANGFLAYLEKQRSSLAEATPSHLVKWALTPIASGRGKGNVSNAQAFKGAKALCAFAAQFGHIDAQRAQELAQCSHPQTDRDQAREVPAFEAGKRTAESSNSMFEAVNKCLRIDDQEASPSMVQSFSFPQSDDLYRELALSHPFFYSPDQHVSSSLLGNAQTLIDQLESLEQIHASSLRFFTQSLEVQETISYLMSAEPQSLQQAKEALIERNPSAYQRLLELELEVLKSLSLP